MKVHTFKDHNLIKLVYSPPEDQKSIKEVLDKYQKSIKIVSKNHQMSIKRVFKDYSLLYYAGILLSI
jgi:tetrahydromethanopterin S-methyltransferase subunit G